MSKVLGSITILMLLLSSLLSAHEQELLAFPTAQGGGAKSVGGRGGRVIKVTTLNGSGKGSLREACEAKGARTVIFSVGGTIDLKGKDIVISNDNITIVGQTATGDGIQIKNGSLIIRANEVIVRYLKIRLGMEYMNDDALTIGAPNRHERKKNIIIDHVSAYWGVDETIDAGSFNDNITVQWSIIAEGLHCSIYNDNGKGEAWKPCKQINGKSVWAHSRGIMVTEESKNITLHHNLIYRNYKRNPLIQSSQVNLINNVIVNYQYQVYIEPFKAPVEVNVIGNYFRSFIHKRPPIRVFDYNRGYDGSSGVYYRDNYDAFFRKDTKQPESNIRSLSFNAKSIDKDGHVKDSLEPYGVIGVKVEPVYEAYQKVLKGVGANYPKRDEVDLRVIKSIAQGEAPKTFVNNPNEVGGYPILKSGVAPLDSDGDGIPNSWEKQHGLDAYNVKDGNSKNLSKIGYTNLEMYLNELIVNL